MKRGCLLAVVLLGMPTIFWSLVHEPAPLEEVSRFRSPDGSMAVVLGYRRVSGALGIDRTLIELESPGGRLTHVGAADPRYLGVGKVEWETDRRVHVTLVRRADGEKGSPSSGLFRVGRRRVEVHFETLRDRR